MCDHQQDLFNVTAVALRACRRRFAGGTPGAELLSGNAEAAGHTCFRLGDAVHSPDHRLLAYTVDTTGTEYYITCIKELAGGALPDPDATAQTGSRARPST